jgi:ADP-ribose pyrophosphatase
LLGAQAVVIEIFRHGLRDWLLEIPRGACDVGESPELAAHRELREEIGANIRELIPLGSFTPGGSSQFNRGHLFAARIDQIGQPEIAEGIAAIRTLDLSELDHLIRTSRIIDGFTLSTYLRARLAGIV